MYTVYSRGIWSHFNSFFNVMRQKRKTTRFEVLGKFRFHMHTHMAGLWWFRLMIGLLAQRHNRPRVLRLWLESFSWLKSIWNYFCWKIIFKLWTQYPVSVVPLAMFDKKERSLMYQGGLFSGVCPAGQDWLGKVVNSFSILQQKKCPISFPLQFQKLQKTGRQQKS